MLRLQVGDLLLEGRPAGQRLAGEVLAAEREGLAPLVLQLGGLGLELVELELQALAGGRHVGDAATDLLEQLQLLLVRVVKGLARILGPVQGLVGLRAEDHPHPLHDTAHGPRAPPSDRVTSGFGSSTSTDPTVRAPVPLPHCSGPDALLLQDDQDGAVIRRRE